jgi:hypothetical protein
MKLPAPVPDPKVEPTPYNMRASGDAAPFDSVSGIGLDSNPSAGAGSGSGIFRLDPEHGEILATPIEGPSCPHEEQAADAVAQAAPGEEQHGRERRLMEQA